jgi:hypothetical protein
MLKQPAPLEARPYGPDSTPDEIAAIKSRVYQLEPSIYIWHEVPMCSVFTSRLHGQVLNELTAGLPSYSYIVDLREAKPPAQEVRAALVKMYNQEMPRCSAIAVWTGRNFLLNVAAKFVLAGFIGLKKRCTLHSTFEDALATLRDA